MQWMLGGPEAGVHGQRVDTSEDKVQGVAMARGEEGCGGTGGHGASGGQWTLMAGRT